MTTYVLSSIDGLSHDITKSGMPMDDTGTLMFGLTTHCTAPRREATPLSFENIDF